MTLEESTATFNGLGAPGVAIVGTGAAAQFHVDAMRRIGLHAPVWVVGRTREQARVFASMNDVRQWTDCLEVALADASIRLVVVATPTDLHCRQAVESLSAGKDVLIEIPIATSLAEAMRVHRAVVRSGRVALVCHTMRTFDGVREVRRRVRSGEIRITQVAGYFSVPRRENEGSAGVRRWVDSLLWHHACHQLDTSLWVLGFPPVQRVVAMEGRRHRDLDMALDLGLIAVTQDQTLITQALTYNSSTVTWELRFMSDTEVLHFRDGGLFDERGATIVPAAHIQDFRGIWRDVIMSSTGAQDSELGIDTILPVMSVLQSASESLDSEL